MIMEKIKNQPLEEHVVRLIDELERVDIVVGIPSFNNQSTIEKVIGNYGLGLKKYFPSFKCLIVNSDGGSGDGTVSRVNSTQVPEGVEKVSTIYKGPNGKGSALRTIFEIARRLDAKVCVVSDADTRSISPEWAKSLIDPVLFSGYGYVAPYYCRDKHDGTITNALVYPMLRALYGLRIRQPIGGDFAFSDGAIELFTRNKYWDRYPYISKFGVDIWMTTTAINSGFRTCQAVLGAKVHGEKDPGKNLSDMFIQVVGTMFDMMEYYEFRWKNIISSTQGPIYGDFKFFEVEKVEVNFEQLIKKFFQGYEKFNKLWEAIFLKDTYTEFKRLLKIRNHFTAVSVDLWTKIVYEFASAYNFAAQDEKELILKVMLPFYFIRTASFIKEVESFSDEIADAVIEGDAGVFERMKPYLKERWDYYKNNAAKISIKSLL